jgi:hypothetical protein
LEPGAEVYLLPVAIRYHFVQDMAREIDKSISRLEAAVGMNSDVKAEPYSRVRAVGERVVQMLEKQYDLKPEDEASLGDRMDLVKRTQLERAADIAKVKLRDGSLSEQMRAVINAVHRVTQDESNDQSHYAKKLWRESKNHLQPALHELDRLANWIAVYDGYVAEKPTPERMVHLLVRMEQEVLGTVSIKGRQVARVGVAEAISLSDYSEAYAMDKRTCVAEVTEECEGRTQGLLGKLASDLRISNEK